MGKTVINNVGIAVLLSVFLLPVRMGQSGSVQGLEIHLPEVVVMQPPQTEIGVKCRVYHSSGLTSYGWRLVHQADQHAVQLHRFTRLLNQSTDCLSADLGNQTDFINQTTVGLEMLLYLKSDRKCLEMLQQLQSGAGFVLQGHCFASIAEHPDHHQQLTNHSQQQFFQLKIGQSYFDMLDKVWPVNQLHPDVKEAPPPDWKHHRRRFYSAVGFICGMGVPFIILGYLMIYLSCCRGSSSFDANMFGSDQQ